MTSRALDQIMMHCAQLSDRMASAGSIDEETYAAMTKVISNMGRCWRDDELEGFNTFLTLYLTHYHLILWSKVQHLLEQNLPRTNPKAEEYIESNKYSKEEV